MSTITNIVLQVLDRPIWQDKIIKAIQIRKKKKKGTLSLFADDMISCVQNPKDSTKNLLELINKFSTGYKNDKHKSIYILLILFLWRTLTNLYDGTEWL